MSAEEIVRIVRIGVERSGVRELRLTGGEPLVRPTCWTSSRRSAGHPDLPISMTTNAVGWQKGAPAQGRRA